MDLQYEELRPTSGWDLLASLGHPSKFQEVSHLGSVTALQYWASAKLCGVEQRATYIRQGGHHVGHWPTFRLFWIVICCANRSLHFMWVVDDVKCVAVTRVCVSFRGCMPTLLHGPWGIGRGCPLVVHYWADLQLVHWLHCYGNITQTRNVSEYMLVLAVCLV